jgi:hypothetical protein
VGWLKADAVMIIAMVFDHAAQGDGSGAIGYL